MMNGVEYFEAGRWLEAELPLPPAATHPEGCRGPACPAFALCQERREAGLGRQGRSGATGPLPEHACNS
jgi:hypothetical protein